MKFWHCVVDDTRIAYAKFHPKCSLGCENKIFAIYNILNSHLSHKRMRRSISERKDAHNDTKNMWDMCCRFGDKFMEKSGISTFFLMFFALAGMTS